MKFLEDAYDLVNSFSDIELQFWYMYNIWNEQGRDSDVSLLIAVVAEDRGLNTANWKEWSKQTLAKCPRML